MISIPNPNRLVNLIVKHTGLSTGEVESRLIALERLPIGEIEYTLADYYEEAARMMAAYMGILRQIRDLTRDGIPLDDLYARESMRKVELKLKAITQKMDEVERKVKVFADELKDKMDTTISARLAHVDKCEDGLFILRFRAVDPAAPSGLAFEDSALIFVDTTPGKLGALAYVYPLNEEPL